MFPNPHALAVQRRQIDNAAKYLATIRRGSVGTPDLTRGGVARRTAIVIATDVHCRVIQGTLTPGKATAGTVTGHGVTHLAFPADVDIMVGDYVDLVPRFLSDTGEQPTRWLIETCPPFAAGRAECIAYASPAGPGQPAGPL